MEPPRKGNGPLDTGRDQKPNGNTQPRDTVTSSGCPDGVSGESEKRNQNVLFVHSTLDDAGIPYQGFRVLADLARRKSGNQKEKNPGIDAIATVCRMNRASVIAALPWLEEHGLIRVERSPRKIHRYTVLVDRSRLWVHGALDDFKLTPVQFRVLAHIARLANTEGQFFVNVSRFARICGLRRETVVSALKALEGLGLYFAYAAVKNPMHMLELDTCLPDQPTNTNAIALQEGVTETGTLGDGNEYARCRKEVRYLTEIGNVSVSNEVNPISQSNEGYPVPSGPTPPFFALLQADEEVRNARKGNGELRPIGDILGGKAAEAETEEAFHNRMKETFPPEIVDQVIECGKGKPRNDKKFKHQCGAVYDLFLRAG